MTSKEAMEEIKRIAGDEAFLKICEKLAGATVYFPANYEWNDKDQRDISLREDFYGGQYEISDLARKYDLSISRVYKIIQKRA